MAGRLGQPAAVRPAGSPGARPGSGRPRRARRRLRGSRRERAADAAPPARKIRGVDGAHERVVEKHAAAEVGRVAVGAPSDADDVRAARDRRRVGGYVESVRRDGVRRAELAFGDAIDGRGREHDDAGESEDGGSNPAHQRRGREEAGTAMAEEASVRRERRRGWRPSGWPGGGRCEAASDDMREEPGRQSRVSCLLHSLPTERWRPHGRLRLFLNHGTSAQGADGPPDRRLSAGRLGCPAHATAATRRADWRRPPLTPFQP